jgi:copper transport protein
MALRRLAAVATLALGAALAPASAAEAHALLLRTEPAPQTTVKAAPPAVKLFFSEPVEVTFGAIRVFDVDGKRVDPGTLHRVGNGTQVDVPLAGIKDGTYTVTWRAVSADGHPVRGGFTFYVGNPSPISAVAVSSEGGSGRLIGWGFGGVRFAWFAALLVLVGGVVVRRWVWTPAVGAAGLARSEAGVAFRGRFRPVLLGAWAVLAGAGVLALVFQAATASGLSLASAARPSVLGQVLHTSFGRLWLAQSALTAALAVPVLGLAGRRRRWGVDPATWIAMVVVVGAVLAAVAGWSGHARTAGRPALGVASVAVHLVAVAVWVGGLGVLVAVGAPAWRALPEPDRPRLLRQLLPRFSRLAVAAVAVVVATGVVNAVLELGAPGDLWRLSYGRAVAAKIVFLLAALALAARHRWILPARLAGADGGGPGAAEGQRAVGSFERSSAWEAVLLGLSVAVTAGLVVLVPGRTVALAASGPVNQTARAGRYTVQLYIDPTTVGANEVHVSFVTAGGLAAAEVANASVSLTPAGATPAIVSMRLISPGHFVGDADLAGPGRYVLSVDGGAGSATSAATFAFRLRQAKGARS